jgi:hypothetical protein
MCKALYRCKNMLKHNITNISLLALGMNLIIFQADNLRRKTFSELFFYVHKQFYWAFTVCSNMCLGFDKSSVLYAPCTTHLSSLLCRKLISMCFTCYFRGLTETLHFYEVIFLQVYCCVFQALRFLHSYSFTNGPKE